MDKLRGSITGGQLPKGAWSYRRSTQLQRQYAAPPTRTPRSNSPIVSASSGTSVDPVLHPPQLLIIKNSCLSKLSIYLLKRGRAPLDRVRTHPDASYLFFSSPLFFVPFARLEEWEGKYDKKHMKKTRQASQREGYTIHGHDKEKSLSGAVAVSKTLVASPPGPAVKDLLSR